jgi:hypothetical protein
MVNNTFKCICEYDDDIEFDSDNDDQITNYNIKEFTVKCIYINDDEKEELITCINLYVDYSKEVIRFIKPGSCTVRHHPRFGSTLRFDPSIDFETLLTDDVRDVITITHAVPEGIIDSELIDKIVEEINTQI